MNSKLITALLVGIITLTSSCKRAQKSDSTEIPNGDITSTDMNTMGDTDSGNPFGLKTVYFPYDGFILDSTGKEVLKNNAEILKANPNLKVQIEGHCDTRGGVQYNVALGEKRAATIKKHLQELGVSTDKLSMISYGKEKLADSGNTEEAHAKNRRGNFAVTAK